MKSQTPATHAAVAFAGGVQARHEGPHDAIESATQVLLQKFGVAVEAQRSPQLTPSHVVVVPLPIGPSGQTAQRLPHVATEKFDTHCPLHSWKPTLH